MVLYEPVKPKKNPYVTYTKEYVNKVAEILERHGYIFQKSKLLEDKENK